ncbi:GspH/FimT family pseudopilin [Pseudoalteromonas sp. BDTF-M6]|uniref:GspH/FimT family pseudopilin n=1 Tax=Pseudoalteromonas sp. BDTF-M6 TaxID=2796132 RepID=UPI001BAF123B|nr:GspH/FimT family pseudopilin [Pseudoalteromonas sp. BDTF-M6]MBS3796235.1 GspH/FimT family pseudopilin [Pseudoalteromonas sp. BDTF-M6]
MKNHHLAKQRGFTLIELMVTIAIGAILLGIALFSTTQMTNKEKANNFAMEFKRQVKFARAKAMTTGDPVVMCAMATPGSDGACAADWMTGTIIMFSDINNNGTFENSADILLRSVSSLVSNSKIKSTATNMKLTFDQRGQVGAGETGSFIYCPSADNKYNIQLEVMSSGTIRNRGKTTSTCDS